MKKILKFLAGVLLALGLLVAALLVVFWAPDVPVQQLSGQWAPPPSQFVAIGGMQVHLRDEGPRDDPHPIVLLHGTSASLHTWDGWVPALSGTRRVIRVDLPGFGLTGPFPDDDYRTAAYSRFMGQLLDTLGVPSAVLVGNSFGAQVAMEFALDAPARVHQLVLLDALVYPPNAESVPLGFLLAATPGVNRLMQWMLPRAAVEASLREVYGDPSKVTPALVDRYFDIARREGNREALRLRFAHLPTEESAARIRAITTPTLILWGGRDRLIPPANAERLQRDIAGSRLVLLPDLGHVPQEEDPDTSVVPVLEFLTP